MVELAAQEGLSASGNAMRTDLERPAAAEGEARRTALQSKEALRIQTPREGPMAEMIPDRLPSGASAGERKVFALLQQLPDDVIVYYEPVVADRYPDFIVIIPSIGLLVIEVKGWYPNSIERADNAEVVISTRGQREVCKHPVRQARDYKFQLMNVARRHAETGNWTSAGCRRCFLRAGCSPATSSRRRRRAIPSTG
jgi:hypothetical protein